MVIDTSAILAILLGEPAASGLLMTFDADPARLISAATLVELGIVVAGRAGAEGSRRLDRFLAVGEVDAVPFDRTHADLAVEAWRRFGKGRHPAGLNLGDCFTYALAKATGEAVLCVGGDFPRTDVAVVPVP